MGDINRRDLTIVSKARNTQGKQVPWVDIIRDSTDLPFNVSTKRNHHPISDRYSNGITRAPSYEIAKRQGLPNTSTPVTDVRRTRKAQELLLEKDTLEIEQSNEDIDPFKFSLEMLNDPMMIEHGPEGNVYPINKTFNGEQINVQTHNEAAHTLRKSYI